jgi:hypothetical protein
VPYTEDGTWVDPDSVRTGACGCPGCAEWQRIHGVTPNEQWLNGLVEAVYTADGFDQNGFTREGRDREGYSRGGYDLNGFNRHGYNSRGYDRDGFNVEGVDRYGYDRYGRDIDGYNREGFTEDGYDRRGWNTQGYNRAGFNMNGFDRAGFDTYGFDTEGYDRYGYDREGYNSQDLNRDGEQRPCDCHECRLERNELPMLAQVSTMDVIEHDTDEYDDLYDDRSYGGSDWLQSYSYTPSLIFRRSHGEDRNTTPYYGLEIEMSSDLSDQERVLGNRLGLDGRLLYFKHDGSVEGFEMVTHPMTAKWARDNFPWHVVEVMAECGASVMRDSNGLHIHVSRAGFSNEAHLYRWLKFWYRNQEQIVNIAGRDGERWGKFDENQRELHGEHAMARAKIRHNHREAEILRSAETGPRYCAINLQNDKTVEVRIFSSTTNPDMLRTRFDLVSGSVEYTRGLSVGKIRKDGWTWDSFALWLDENASTYPALADHETTNILSAIGRRNEAREPARTLA